MILEILTIQGDKITGKRLFDAIAIKRNDVAY